MIKTQEEINKIRNACKLVSEALGVASKLVRRNTTPIELDAEVEKFIRANGAEPAFKGYRGFPNSCCISVNEEVVHGIPNKRKFRDGDIVSVDCGVKLDGFYGDSAYTFTVGKVSPAVQHLLHVTRESLYAGIAAAKAGNHVGDIGHTVQMMVEHARLYVVRQLAGHGVGKELHEAPEVPNYGEAGSGVLLQPGMVLAIEPMVNMGTWLIREANDGWTIYAADRKPAAHFEHTILITEGGADILTSFEPIEGETNVKPTEKGKEETT